MTSLDPKDLPVCLEELDADWLTAAFRDAGVLREGRVASLGTRRIGEGEGFSGVVARLSLDYAGAAPGAPRSAILKLPTDVPENRTMGELMGVYWREIHFYRELAGKLPIRTPAHYYSSLTPDPMRTRQSRLVAILDRLPAFLVDRLVELTKRTMQAAPHRYVLIIEDLAPARVGDQVSGGSREVCAAVLDVAAKLHASHWGSPAVARLGWLLDATVNARIRHRMYLEAKPDFLARHGESFSDERGDALRWLDRNGAALGRRLNDGAPITVIHGDMRLDNVFFADAPAEGGDAVGRVILADWQLAGKGCGAYDVAYLLCGSLDAATPVETEMDLLRGYHAALVRAGVEDYAFERFLRDYRRALLAILQTLATSNTVDLGADRGTRLMDLWVERTAARLADVPLDGLL